MEFWEIFTLSTTSNIGTVPQFFNFDAIRLFFVFADFFETKAMKVEVYRGYVDDPRNTDNAWMETVAINFHDGKG